MQNIENEFKNWLTKQPKKWLNENTTEAILKKFISVYLYIPGNYSKVALIINDIESHL